MPLMKTSGNFVIVDIIITVEVMLVGVDENINPIAEKQNAASTIPTARTNGCSTVTSLDALMILQAATGVVDSL